MSFFFLFQNNLKLQHINSNTVYNRSTMTTTSNSTHQIEGIIEFDPYNSSHTDEVLQERANFLFNCIKNNENEVIIDSLHEASLQYHKRKWIIERTEILKILQMKQHPTAAISKRPIGKFYTIHIESEEDGQPVKKKAKMYTHVSTIIKIEQV